MRRVDSENISLQQKARAVVGGALACAFIAAAFAHLIPGVSDGLITTAAAVAGGVMGKFYLISKARD